MQCKLHSVAAKCQFAVLWISVGAIVRVVTVKFKECPVAAKCQFAVLSISVVPLSELLLCGGY